MDAARMGAWQWDMATDRFSSFDGLGHLFGVARESGPQDSKEFLNAVHPADRERLARAVARDRKSGAPGQLEYRALWPDGSIHWLLANTNVTRDANGKPARMVGLVTDITERKQAEIALERANRALKTLSAGNEELVRATSESDLLHAVCRVIVEKGGYRMAAVGYPEDDADKTITVMASAGDEQGYFTSLTHTWADTKEGQRPGARAIRTKLPAIARNIPDDPAFAPLRERGVGRGFVSNLALPLLDGTRLIGVLSIHAEEKEAFDDAEIQLLEELSRDLAYGITTLRTRAERDRIAHEHRHHAEILRRSLEDSIQAIAFTVEMRDPYTSGHQKRVADLAVAIAGAMGLDEEKIHGIHLAGVVHDLGKIRVPAEILAKPGKLTMLEFELVKVHPQVGYDILKDIKFPWPIAAIVWEHHERMDGSGYPRGLKREEILVESRIMAVADVVEAMASHRPYRASLGIEPALREIERGRGTVYDAAAVDACVKLFREGGFVLQI
jgi:HD-GYP domain-containing protein (c-di-GMP phosphodiesterase class II)